MFRSKTIVGAVLALTLSANNAMAQEPGTPQKESGQSAQEQKHLKKSGIKKSLCNEAMKIPGLSKKAKKKCTPQNPEPK